MHDICITFQSMHQSFSREFISCSITACLYVQLVLLNLTHYRYNMTIPACVLMILTFLFELTYEKPETRSKIYKAELTKVFFTIVLFYFMTMIMANWLLSLKKFLAYNESKLAKKRIQEQQKAARTVKPQPDDKIKEEKVFSFRCFTLFEIFE